MECQKQEYVPIKSEHVPFYKSAIDLSQDNDAIEPEVDRIADSISANIHGALKYTLQPFVKQYNNKCNQHSVISGVLRQLPEFQKLVSENAELKMEINNLKKEFQINEKITLEVHEKQCHENDHNSVRLVNEFYKEIQTLEDGDIALSCHGNMESSNTLETSEDGSVDEDEQNSSASGSDEEEEDDSASGSEVEVVEEKAEEEEEEEEDEVVEPEVEEVEEEEEEEEEVEEVEEEVEEVEEEADVDDVDDVDGEAEEVAGEEVEVVDGEAEEDDGEAEEVDVVDVEKEEEEEEVEVVDVEEEEEEEDSASGSEDDEGEEEELYIVEMELDGKDIQYYTNDDENGEIYTILEDDEVGEQVGVFKDGEPIFS